MPKKTVQKPAVIEPGSRADTLLVRWRASDTPMGVTRDTVRKLSAHFGITDTALIHLALRGLANDVWPIQELEASSEALDREYLDQQQLSAAAKRGRSTKAAIA